jgi:PTH2 family peptidyl-tRNA hydrolase
MSEEDNNKILNIISKYDDYKHSVYNIDENEQSYVMYNVVNTSLKMGKGKLAAQVGHGVHKMAQYCLHHEKEVWMKYINSNYPKIVLKTKSQDHLMDVLEKTKDIFKCYVVDEGRTQIAKNSLTVVSYIPMVKENVPNVLKLLKLL